MMRGTNLHFELEERQVGTACGGIGLMHQLAQRLERQTKTPILFLLNAVGTLITPGRTQSRIEQEGSRMRRHVRLNGDGKREGWAAGLGVA